MSKIIVYKNRYNEVKAYELEYIRDRAVRFDAKLRGTGQIKTFVYERILAEGFSTFESADREAIILQKDYELDLPVRMPSRDGWNNPEGKFEVCFTGFRKADKERLQRMASEAGFKVRSKPTKDLGVLVCGYNTGPSKLAVAKAQGTDVVQEIEGFIEYIERGKGFDSQGRKVNDSAITPLIFFLVLVAVVFFYFL